ncbi:type IV toxin-antitoxin system AbiEi family antitoxin domain-containing protein [Rhodococcoides kyotonense]|uniref:Transcriptional regulator, AbiEi antitoxin, Type IV TA system n=1 Tax=Rhodococcoides kyotonense TaxID=398843 RepID=A0A239LFK2_9NOCA|nr:type IV toxin-antitoxin system AbiEi family antitoxin domain-containing protein [Rhodococcus kyotonensis]SNT29115.1 Transcriptional regulator, AbiEi antitoxin, Type IV TA system [Rhodococcus kyotonensis]
MEFDQPGMFTRAEALATGFTDDDLRRGRATGTIVTVRRGYFIRTALYREMTAHQQHSLLSRAVYQESGNEAVLSHVSAAVVHGMDTWNIPLDKVNLTIGRSYAGKKGRRRILHGTSIDAGEWTTTDGLRVTTPARTVVDLALSTTPAQAVSVGDYALNRRLTTATELDEALASAHGKTGIAQARHAVGLMSSRSESVGESRSRLLLGAMQIPTPLLNQWVYDGAGKFVARVDFLWPELGVIGEFDGRLKYKSKADDVAIAEKNRENRLVDLGWTVVRWEWDELESPQLLRARFEAAFARAAKHSAPGGTYSDTRRR